MPYKDFWKSYAVFMKLPEVWRQVNQLEREIKNINANK
jgi:hypothetical protein